MKFLIGYLSIYLAFGANAFADDFDSIAAKCSTKVSDFLYKPNPKDKDADSDKRCANSAIAPYGSSDIFKNCISPFSKYGEEFNRLQSSSIAQCTEIKKTIPSFTDQAKAPEEIRGLRTSAANNMRHLYDQSAAFHDGLLENGRKNIQLVSKSEYLNALPQEFKPLYEILKPQFASGEFKKGGNATLASNSIFSITSRLRDQKAKVAVEQLATANFIAERLKRLEDLKLDFRNSEQKFTQGANDIPDQNNTTGNSDDTSNGNPLSSAISGLTDPNTLMGLASIGASLAPMFMQQSQQQKKQKTPKEKPETQSSSLSSVGKPNNGVGFSQPTAPEVKTTTGENPATPNSAEFNSAKSDISDKSTPLTTAGGDGSSSSTSKPSDAAGGAGASGALAAKNEKKEEAPKPQSSATDDTLGGLGGGGAGALGYSPPPDHESPLKDILPTDAHVAEGENTDAVIGNGEMENGAREVASEEDQIKSPESLFFRVRGTLSRCQKKGCVSSTAGNAAKNLPF